MEYEQQFAIFNAMRKKAGKEGLEYEVLETFCRDILKHLTSTQVFDSSYYALSEWDVL